MEAKVSTAYAENLALLSNAALQVFANVEKDAQAKVAKARSEAEDAKLERDESASALRVSRKEENAWKDEAATCKSALDQAELTINHQTETISQLRREATQWKDQARNWQEHFLRVEQERCRLSSRIEELATERVMYHNPITMASLPYTPQQQYPTTILEPPSASSTTTKRASTSSRESPDIFADEPPAAKKSKILQPASDSPSKHSQVSKPKIPRNATTARTPTRTQHPVSPAQSRSEPRQTVIRRVQALVQIPVKEEDDDDSVELFSKSGPGLQRTPDTGTATKRQARQTTSRRKSKRAMDDEDSYSEHRGAESEDDDSEDEDELRMGAEPNRKELYSATAFKPPVAPSSAKRKPQASGRAMDKRSKH